MPTHARVSRVASVFASQRARKLEVSEERAARLNALVQKNEQYRDESARLQDTLTHTGVDPSLYHGALLGTHAVLQELLARLHSQETALAAFHALPPVLSLIVLCCLTRVRVY